MIIFYLYTNISDIVDIDKSNILIGINHVYINVIVFFQHMSYQNWNLLVKKRFVYSSLIFHSNFFGRLICTLINFFTISL